MAHLAAFGRPAALSDGDIVFQPRKIHRFGIWHAVEGRVLMYVHKEKVLDQVQNRYPAKPYVMVDDKSNILAAMKKFLGARLTTGFARRGVTPTILRCRGSAARLGDRTNRELDCSETN